LSRASCPVISNWDLGAVGLEIIAISGGERAIELGDNLKLLEPTNPAPVLKID
jgi:hypothetical protein